MNLIIFFTTVFSMVDEYNVKFIDGIKSYDFDHFYDIFDVYSWMERQGTEKEYLLTLDNLTSDTFEILRNATNGDVKHEKISFKEFISCCEMIVASYCSEIFSSGEIYVYPDLIKAYKRLCDALEDEKKSYFSDTVICESENKLLLFNYIDREDRKIVYITEPMENLYETSDIKDLEQFFSFFNSKNVQEIRILKDFLSDELFDELSKNKTITRLFVMSESDNKVDITFDLEKINHMEYLALDIEYDFQEIILGINKLKNLTHLKLGIESAENKHLKLLDNNTELKYLDLKINEPKEGNFREISKLKGIETLMLRSKGSFDLITGTEEMPNLKGFKLRNIDFPQDMYEVFKFMPNLEVLDLEGIKLQDNFGKSISHLKKLKELNVNNTGIDTENFNQITEITSLTILKMKNSNVEEYGWRKIANLKYLVELDYEKDNQENCEYQNSSDRVAIRKLPRLPDEEKYFKYFRYPRITRQDFDKDNFEPIDLYNQVESFRGRPGESFTINIYMGTPAQSTYKISRDFEEYDSLANEIIYSMIRKVERSSETKFTVEIIFDY